MPFHHSPKCSEWWFHYKTLKLLALPWAPTSSWLFQQHPNAGFIFHPFLDNTNNWIWRILEFRKKSLSLGKNSLSLAGKFWSLFGKIAIFALKLHKNCRIFEFRFKICLSLEKILEFRKKSLSLGGKFWRFLGKFAFLL